MPRPVLGSERESEMAAVWGREKFSDGSRAPARRGRKKAPGTQSDEHEREEALKKMAAKKGKDDDGNDSDWSEPKDGNESDFSDLVTDDESNKKKTKNMKKAKEDARKKAKKEKHRMEYRLHCVIAPGTGKNELREVFEQYEPTVSIRTAQKGNLLNKTHFAVLTFPNKAMAMHAVTKIDGTDKRDLIGVNPVSLKMMLTRLQSKRVKARQTKRRRRK